MVITFQYRSHNAGCCAGHIKTLYQSDPVYCYPFSAFEIFFALMKTMINFWMKKTVHNLLLLRFVLYKAIWHNETTNDRLAFVIPLTRGLPFSYLNLLLYSAAFFLNSSCFDWNSLNVA